MKKYFLFFMICTLLALSASSAMAAQAQNELTFIIPDGTEYLVVLPEGGAYISGYKKENDTWVTQFSGQCIGNYDPGFLRRHDTKTARPDASFFPDDLGFDYVSSLTGACDSYHFDGENFSVAGWYDPAYNGHVMVKGLSLEYYPLGSSIPECTVTAADDDTLSSWTHLARPLTPDMARSYAAMQKSAVENAYPGYTLYSYDAYSIGKLQADALFGRLEGNTLHIKAVLFDPDTAPAESDRMPLPLSDEIAGMKKDIIFGTLGEYGDWGLTQLSRQPIDLPLPGNMIDLDLQKNCAIALTEDEKGLRRVSVIALNDQGHYEVKTSVSLPDGIWMDTFHAGEGELLLAWNEQRQQAGYSLSPQGDWQLSWVMNSTEEGSFNYGVSFWQVQVSDELRLIGSLQGVNLWEGDLNALPKNEKELRAALNKTGWAVVNNPDPADRLHLREKADRSSESLGKFYNGTPVQVLKKQGDWYQVRIGQSALTGWMMKKYLAEGDKMDTIRPAFPDLVPRDAYYDHPDLPNTRYDLIGVYQGNQYILLTRDGEIYLAPMDWFFEGNG